MTIVKPDHTATGCLLIGRRPLLKALKTRQIFMIVWQYLHSGDPHACEIPSASLRPELRAKVIHQFQRFLNGKAARAHTDEQPA